MLFVKLWGKRGNSCFNEKGKLRLSVEEVIEKVWEPVYENLQAIKKRICDGTMFFTEFKRLYGELNLENLKKELEHFSSESAKGWIDDRIRQIQEHRSVQQCVDGALVIKKLVDAYVLEGNFEQIDLIIDMVCIYFLIYVFEFLALN